MEENSPFQSCLGLIVLLIVSNVLLFGFGKIFAPIIWRSENDKLCQENGYWYAEGSNLLTSVNCKSWFVKPR
jgi:hypothetical protein